MLWFFDELLMKLTKTFQNIRKNATVQWDDYAKSCLLDYPYFKEIYILMAVV